jgi:hypothetical protein
MIQLFVFPPVKYLYPFLFLKRRLASRLTLFTIPPIIGLWSCNHRNVFVTLRLIVLCILLGIMDYATSIHNNIEFLWLTFFTLCRTVAQAVSHQLPTAKAWVPARVRSCGICGGQSGTRAGFIRVLLVPLPSIPPTAPHSSSSIFIRGWYNRPVVATVILDLVPLPPPPKKKGEG